jgi:hypothetical protein
MPVKACSKCGRVTKGYYDRKTGTFICLSCRASRVKACYICNQEMKIHTRIGNGVYVCEDCSKCIASGKCSHCGAKGTVIEREGEQPACYACDARVPAVCCICDSIVKFYKKDPNGNIMCKKCYTPAPRLCMVCGKTKTPHKKTAHGHICKDCYEHPLRECSVCGNHRLGYKKIDDGKFLCRLCYYSTLLKEEIDAARGTFEKDWTEKLFFEYIEDKGRVQSSEIVWKAVKRDKPLFEMLGRDFKDLSDITTEDFWRKYHHMPRRRTGQLYSFLVDRGYIELTGTLSEDYIRQHRIRNMILSMPEGFRPTIMKYYDRFVMLRDKKLAAGWKDTDYGTGSYGTMEGNIIALRCFIGYLIGLGLKSISEIAVYHVEDYLAENIGYVGALTKFLKWLRQEQQITWKYRERIRSPRYSTPPPINEEKYAYILDRLLEDAHPLKETIITLLALIYGLRPRVLRRIKVYDLKEKDNKLYLKLPYFELELHSEISDRIRKYLQESFLPNPFDIDNPYLFFGYTYKEPMDSKSIINVFKKHGLKSHQLLPTVIQKLFNEKVRHPAVISKITGIHKTTAVRYFDSFNPSVYEEINLNRKLYGKIK